jgi:hypothetical protein
LVIGGGVVNAWDEYADALQAPCDLVPALLGNDAGIVGAALYAATTVRP